MKLTSCTFVHKMFYILQVTGSWPIFAAGEKEVEIKDQLIRQCFSGLIKEKLTR